MNLITGLFNHLFTYPIFNALMFLYRLFGDFGFSIIVLTIALSLVLLPLTLRQLKSARATFALRSELAEIRRQKEPLPIVARKTRRKTDSTILVLSTCFKLDSIGYTMGVSSTNVPRKADTDRRNFISFWESY
jgi:hypothetical protein